MIDKEIIDYVRDCNKDLAETITKSVDLTMKNTSLTILADNQRIVNKVDNIQKSVEEVKDKVGKQNGSIRGLQEWRAGVEGGKATVKNMAPWASIIIAALLLIFTVYNNSRINKEQGDIWDKLWWKQDRVIDSTTRSGYVPYLLNDTIK